MLVIMIEALFDETRLLFHALKEWAEAVHSDVGVTVSMRAVLEILFLRGATSVPEMARARLVSRQHIQQQVDALLDQKLVRREPNPAHKRSSLITLTDSGRALIQNMRAEELGVLTRLQTGVSDNAVRNATQVLAAWKDALTTDARRRKR